jgi:hypothetical protein
VVDRCDGGVVFGISRVGERKAGRWFGEH